MAIAKKLPYYSFNALLSYNAVFNICVGARGLGKTYGAKKKVIKDALEKGYQFIYLRRFKSELKGRGNFFADIAHEFPNHAFRVQGMTAEACANPLAPEKERQWFTIGFFASLSTAQTQKSVAYPNVRWILFDEFIIEQGSLHYLPDEVAAFMNFYSTVDRWKDKTRVFFLANSLSIVNPYFIAWDIKPSKDNEFITLGNGFVCAHFPDSKEFGNAVYETKFGAFIKGSEFGKFSVESEFADNHDTLVKLKNSDSTYLYTLVTKKGTFAVWRDVINNVFYLMEKRPKAEIFFTLDPGRVSEDVTLVERTSGLMQSLRGAFSHGRMFFENPQTREAFIGVYVK